MSRRYRVFAFCIAMLHSVVLLLSGCSRPELLAADTDVLSGPNWKQLEVTGKMPIAYATQFTVTEYAHTYQLIDIKDSGRFLVVPEGMAAPSGLEDDIVPLHQPLNRIYLAATSAMDLFRAIGGMDSIRLSGTAAEDWCIEEAVQALNSGKMIFAGKYSAPDYELLYSEGCDLAIESTMIYYSPEVKEQLEKLNIPVLVERSSYEANPLGRMEWVKLYGILLGKGSLAQEVFQREVENLDGILTLEGTGKTVAFFYITSKGTVNVRKRDDYIAQLIRMSGGEYISFDREENENALSSTKITMEAFYSGAKDADVLIYNSTIEGELWTMDELLGKSPLLGDFKAVQNGDVWSTGKNLFQEPMGLGKLLLDVHTILSEKSPDPEKMTFLHRLTNGGM